MLGYFLSSNVSVVFGLSNVSVDFGLTNILSGGRRGWTSETLQVSSFKVSTTDFRANQKTNIQENVILSCKMSSNVTRDTRISGKDCQVVRPP